MKIAFIIGSVFVVAVVMRFGWRKLWRPNSNSFWDVVLDPGAMPDLDKFHKDVAYTASKLSGSPTDIGKLVDSFVFDVKSASGAWRELRIIAKLGNETYPRTLEILRDRSMRERLTTLTEQENSLPEAPINRLCNIFDQDAPPPQEAANLLSPYLQSDSDEIRKSVALIIGSIGSVNSIPDLRRALTDHEEYVRSYALMGIQRAISGHRVEQSSGDVFFELVAGLWPDDTSFNVCNKIPLILLRLDRDRAMARLLRDDLFTASFEPVWRILQACLEESVEIPRTRLLCLIEESHKEPLEYPMYFVLEEALTHLGTHRNDDDLAMLERFVNHNNEYVSRGATQGLYRFHRYSELIRNPQEVVESSGWNSLTTAEKHICAIEELDAEVKNGGFAQYYFNSAGDHWQDALNGLAAIEATKHHRLMVTTCDKFTDSKPAADRDTRMAQLSKLVRKKVDPFNEQDNVWYETKDESLDRLMFKYNLANRDGRQKVEPAAPHKPPQGEF